MLSPSFVFNATGWLAVGAAILVSLQRGWIITKSSHEREIGILEKSAKEIIKEKDENYANMVSLKDKAYEDMVKVKDEQLGDQRTIASEWRAAAMASDTRADLLAQNQEELMSGIQVTTRFIEGIYHRTGGAG